MNKKASSVPAAFEGRAVVFRTENTRAPIRHCKYSVAVGFDFREAVIGGHWKFIPRTRLGKYFLRKNEDKANE